jgi:hypothetical protein
MTWRLTQAAWALTGRPIPDDPHEEAPICKRWPASTFTSNLRHPTPGSECETLESSARELRRS